MFLFLCSFYIAFWRCLDLFYLGFIKNFQIIWEEFSFFFTVFHNAFDLRGIRYSTEPGRQAHTGSGGLRYAAKILYEIMLAGFLCLTKPAFMRRPWRIKALPSRPWLGISVLRGHNFYSISTAKIKLLIH